MKFPNRDSQSVTVSKLLAGMMLDSVRVYSAIVQIGFFRPNGPTGIPKEAWVIVSGGLQVNPSADHAVQTFANDPEFFARRALAIGELYLLIGKEITAANILETGSLELALGVNRVLAYSDGDSFDEVWAVVDGSPDLGEDHSWYIALDDSGDVTSRSP